MIRIASDNDLPEIFKLFDERQADLKYKFGKSNRDVFIHSWTKLFPKNAYMVLKSVGDDGKINGFLNGSIFYHLGTGVPMALVHFWYVSPSKRGAGIGVELLKDFEKWAKASGAKFCWFAKKMKETELGDYHSHEIMYVKEF